MADDGLTEKRKIKILEALDKETIPYFTRCI